MKKINFLSIILLVAMSLSMVACSSKDDDEIDLGSFDYPKELLFGTWKASLIYSGGKWVAISEFPQYSMSITFNKNGSFYGEGYLGNGSGTYRLSGKTITTYVDSKVYATYNVKSLSGGVANVTLTIGKESLNMYVANTNYYEGDVINIVTPPTQK